jgi:hypothetical protein
MNLVAIAVEKPVKAAVGVLLVSLFGMIALVTMPVQLTPEVQTPTITVESRWRGASPQEIEQELVQPLEEQLRSVEGLVKLSSESSDSVGTVELEFAVGIDMSQALVKVNTRVQQVRDWPIDADRPVIRTASANDRPVAWLILGQAAPDPKAVAEARAAQRSRPRSTGCSPRGRPTWRCFASASSPPPTLSSPASCPRRSTSRPCAPWPRTRSKAGSSGSTGCRTRISSVAARTSCR